MDLQETMERMHSGRLYLCRQEALVTMQEEAQGLVWDFNHTRPTEREKRRALLEQMFREIGGDSYVVGPIHANWGCRNVRVGRNVVINANVTLLDDTDITIEDDVMLGPNVTLCTVSHPMDPELRRRKAEFNAPVCIGRNAWIGAGTVVLSGVTVGENAIIGANSVVTRDIPANVIAVGNPCRVLREITEYDRTHYGKGLPADLPLE